MNYYEFHIGDYLKNTAHLSMLEDAAYRRLIDAYYTREAPLPIERRACYKLCRAASKDEREAVDYVLDEFFSELDDGWHNDRCDAEIHRFKDKQAKAKRSADARWSKRETHSEGNANASPDAMRTHSEGSAPRARPQSPDTSNQTPDAIAHGVVNSTGGTPAGEICARLRREARMTDMNPSHPKLFALIAAGITADEVVSAGVEAVAKGKGFLYALAVAEGRRRDAASIKPIPDGAQQPQRRTIHDEREAVSMALTGRKPSHERSIANAEPRDITGEATRVA